MDDVCARIRRITTELNALGEDLEWASVRSRSEAHQDAVLDELLKADLVSDFRAAIDRMRHFLWCYVEAAASNGGRCDVDYALQGHRLRRVTEMLQLLRAAGSPELASMPEGRTFFEHVTAMVEEYRMEPEQQPRGKGKAA
jgi:hypothetical protein